MESPTNTSFDHIPIELLQEHLTALVQEQKSMTPGSAQSLGIEREISAARLQISQWSAPPTAWFAQEQNFQTGRKRVRQPSFDSDEDLMPPVRTFAPRVGYVQNQSFTNPRHPPFSPSGPSNNSQPVSDEEFARQLQQVYSAGYSPPLNLEAQNQYPLQFLTSHAEAAMRHPPHGSAPFTPPRFSPRPLPVIPNPDPYDFCRNVIDLSSDDGSVEEDLTAGTPSAQEIRNGFRLQHAGEQGRNPGDAWQNPFAYQVWPPLEVGESASFVATPSRGFTSRIGAGLEAVRGALTGTVRPGVEAFRNVVDLACPQQPDNVADQIVDPAGNMLNGNWSGSSTLEGTSKLSGAVRNYAEYVYNDPTKTVDEIKTLLETIHEDMEIPPENREGTPDAMVYPLMEHQKVGLTWLKKMEEGHTKGGILADDMGLGKTIQTLALMVSRPSCDEKRKTTLIVAPVALLRQWEREIKNKLKAEHSLSVYIFHGSKRTKTSADLMQYDVVLTTYGTVAFEYKQRDKYNLLPAEDRGPEPKLTLLGCKFFRIVLDEAQCIKNMNTLSSRGCSSLVSLYRLALSGTPMQNSCDELYPLLRFLKIKPYDDIKTWNFHFKGLKAKYRDNTALNMLQALLKATLLRRTKTSEIDGKPILTLPPKTVHLVAAVLSEDEWAFYRALEARSKIAFNKYLKQGAVGRNYSNILTLLLRMRQACCHPHLITDYERNDSGVELDGATALVRELAPNVVARIKHADSLECPVCLDVSENPSVVVPCGHLFCKECLLQVQTNHEEQNIARGEETKLRCPGCRGDLDPKKVTDLSTFKSVYPFDGESDIEVAVIGEPEDDLIYDSESDEEVDGWGDLRDFVTPDDEDEYHERVLKSSRGKGKQKANGRPLAEVRKDAMRNEKSKRQYHRYLEKRWVDSAKVSRCIELLQQIEKNDRAEKTIIFSQFTSLLDLLEVPLRKTGIQYQRYDGGMSASKRNQAIIDFQEDENLKVLLVSIKAGNSGLNLVAASQVIIMDPFYNPYVEYQAIDRAHRIGQQRPVTVSRIIVEGTVEDRVLELQNQKRELVEGALDENAARGMGRLSVKDLGFLFGIGQ